MLPLEVELKMSFDSLKGPPNQSGSSGCFPRRVSYNYEIFSIQIYFQALTIGGYDPSHIQIVTVYLYTFNPDSSDQRLKIEFHKRSTTHELIDKILTQNAEGY